MRKTFGPPFEVYSVYIRVRCSTHIENILSINNRQIRIGDGKLDAMRFDSVWIWSSMRKRQRVMCECLWMRTQMRNMQSSVSHFENVVNQPFQKKEEEDVNESGRYVWNIWMNGA